MDVCQLVLFFLSIFLSSESINITFDCDRALSSFRAGRPYRDTELVENYCKNTYLYKLDRNKYLLEDLYGKLDRSMKETFKYYEEKTEEILICGKLTQFTEEDICSICWETTSENPEPEPLFQISPCRHKFCVKCIQNWVQHRSKILPLPPNVIYPFVPCPYCNGGIPFIPKLEDPRPVFKNFQEGKECMMYLIYSLRKHFGVGPKDMAKYAAQDSSIMEIINEAERIDRKWKQFNDEEYVLDRTNMGSNRYSLDNEMEEWRQKVRYIQGLLGRVLRDFKALMEPPEPAQHPPRLQLDHRARVRYAAGSQILALAYTCTCFHSCANYGGFTTA
ncbi:hypothetical protein SNEBB_003063 [Seison nebaliae]|nr:hypothetical protein SNEBB_003063 [Seison nebaliae]